MKIGKLKRTTDKKPQTRARFHITGTPKTKRKCEEEMQKAGYEPIPSPSPGKNPRTIQTPNNTYHLRRTTHHCHYSNDEKQLSMRFYTLETPTPEKKLPNNVPITTKKFGSYDLTADLLRRNPRKRRKAQNQIMGMSASESRKNIEDWLTKRHFDKLYDGETVHWMHMIAFCLIGEQGQVADNLVVGTARSNHNMKHIERKIKELLTENIVAKLKISATADIIDQKQKHLNDNLNPSIDCNESLPNIVDDSDNSMGDGGKQISLSVSAFNENNEVFYKAAFVINVTTARKAPKIYGDSIKSMVRASLSSHAATDKPELTSSLPTPSM